MFRILIADDEKIVVDAVSFIIQKNFEDIQFQTARSGRDAIEIAEGFKPDIILMDIRMPGINGIDAIKEIKNRQKNTLFIIISAYEQFEFAKEAVKLGVIDYLLKPVNKNTIVAAIDNAKRIVETERSRRQKQIENIERYENILPLVEHNFIYSILLGHQSLIISNNYKDILSVKSEGGYILIIELKEKENLSIYEQSIYTSIRNALKYRCNCIVGPLMINRIVTFVSTNFREEYPQRLEAVELAEYVMKKTSDMKDKVELVMGIGSYKDIENITISYEEALKSINFGQKKDINHIKDLVGEAYMPVHYPTEQEKIFLEMCNAGEKDEALNAFNKIYVWVYEKYINYFDEGKNKLLELMVTLHRSVFDNGINLEYYRDYIFDIQKLKDLPALERWCRERIVIICSDLNKAHKKNVNRIILESKKYIDKNYNREITLDEISKETCVSPHYFSRLFKEETSENYIDYLTKIRINKAKELMEKSDLSIKEICFKIGYGDPNYFSRLFKKIEKITPSEYVKGIK